MALLQCFYSPDSGQVVSRTLNCPFMNIHTVYIVVFTQGHTECQICGMSDEKVNQIISFATLAL
jgi:transcription elongation factor Elf1